MADDRIDVVVSDKVSRSIGPKLAEIAKQARAGHSAVVKLNQALGQLKTSALASLTKAASNSGSAIAKLHTANSKLQQQQARTQVQTTKLGVAQNKLAQSNQALAGATARANTQLANQAAAQARAATAAARHQAALAKLQQQQGRQQRGGGNTGGDVGALAGAVSIATGVGYIVQQTNAYQTLQQRLQAVTKTKEEAIAVEERLYKISRDTLAPIESSVILYQRFAPTVQRLGIEQEGLYDIITNLNKAMTLSGASTAEATGALIQLSQAFGANRLSGQELNSVLEQLPIVADVIATQVGITRDQLRKVANEGNITSDELIKAFSNSGK